MAFDLRKGFLIPDTPDTESGGDSLTENFKFAGDEIEALRLLGGGISAKHAIGRLYGNAGSSAAASMPTFANRLIAFPWKLDTARTYDTIYGIMHSVGAGEIAVGVYSDLNGSPDALLVDSGDLGTGTTGLKSAAISLTPTSPDVWLALRATNVVFTRRGAGLFRSIIDIGTDDLTNGLLKVGLFRNSVFAGSLPDPFGAISGLEGSIINIPMVLLKAGS